MPLFQYVCEECEQTSELLIRGEEKPACPYCGSERVTRQVGAFAAMSAGSKGETPSGGCCGPSCGCMSN